MTKTVLISTDVFNYVIRQDGRIIYNIEKAEKKI